MTQQDVQRAFAITATLGAAIRDLTNLGALGGVPSGELYARVMDRIDILDYEAAIDTLKRARLVEERAHLLVWIGDRES